MVSDPRNGKSEIVNDQSFPFPFRFEDEINKRASKEEEFVELKKVKELNQSLRNKAVTR